MTFFRIIKNLLYASLLSFSLFFIRACNSVNQPFSLNDLVVIYAAHELTTPEKAAPIEKKYHLDDPKIRSEYYQTIYDLSSNDENFKAFLNKVDEYQQMQNANQPAPQPQNNL